MPTSSIDQLGRAFAYVVAFLALLAAVIGSLIREQERDRENP